MPVELFFKMEGFYCFLSHNLIASTQHRCHDISLVTALLLRCSTSALES